MWYTRNSLPLLRPAGKALQDKQVTKTWFSLPMPMVGSGKGRIHKGMPSYWHFWSARLLQQWMVTFPWTSSKAQADHISHPALQSPEWHVQHPDTAPITKAVPAPCWATTTAICKATAFPGLPQALFLALLPISAYLTHLSTSSKAACFHLQTASFHLVGVEGARSNSKWEAFKMNCRTTHISNSVAYSPEQKP